MRFKPISVKIIIIGIALTVGIITGTLSFGPVIASNFLTQKDVPIPVFPKNENGQTYGSAALVNSPDQEPDLISAVGVNGVEGYLRAVDLDEEMPKTPEEAVARMKNRKRGEVKEIPLYAVDGKTVVGKFKYGHGKVVEIPAEKGNKTTTP